MEHTPNFVKSLKKAQNEANISKQKEELKADHFLLPKKTSSHQSNLTQNDFDGEVVESSDPHFPGIRLVKRYISREELEKMIPPHTDSLTLTELFKQVYPPDFKRPTTSNANFAIFAIVASRSQVKTSTQGNKYITMTLSDLKYDIILALHGKAHETHWKIQPGTLIAILNPQFWISKVENNRTLNLSVNKASCIVEVGQASDIGQCESMTVSSNNTKRCKNWVDVRKSRVCDFHIEQKATRTKRPELSSQNGRMWDPKSIGKYHTSRMAVIQGGDVKWKRGLQIDSQAPKVRTDLGAISSSYSGFPDNAIGRVFINENANVWKNNPEKYEVSLAEKEKRKQKDKRSLDRATEDSELSQLLDSKASHVSRFKIPEPSRITKPASKTHTDLRKLGFVPKQGLFKQNLVKARTSATPPQKERILKNVTKLNNYPEDDESDLEII